MATFESIHNVRFSRLFPERTTMKSKAKYTQCFA